MRSPGQSHFPGEPNLLALNRHIILANHRTGGLVRGVAAGQPDQDAQEYECEELRVVHRIIGGSMLSALESTSWNSSFKTSSILNATYSPFIN